MSFPGSAMFAVFFAFQADRLSTYVGSFVVRLTRSTRGHHRPPLDGRFPLSLSIRVVPHDAAPAGRMASPVLVRFHSPGNPHLAAELQTAQYHRLRSCAGQRFFIANIVGEGDPHLDLLTLLGGRKRVAGTGSPCYVGTVRQPLVTARSSLPHLQSRTYLPPTPAPPGPYR